MQMPTGYRIPGKVLRVNKVLYGLRRLLLLWQKNFTTTLQSLGFKVVSYEPCIIIKGGILVFFFVDNTVFSYRKEDTVTVQSLVLQLQQTYQLSGSNELQWFLGIEVIKDRSKGLIQLLQTIYFDKIVSLATTIPITKVKVSISTIKLLPYEGKVEPQLVTAYQRKTGLILYTAVITRPDIAFTALRLVRFNNNPRLQHHKAAN